MARRQKNTAGRETPPPAAPKGLDSLGLATLAGTIAVLVISFSNMRAIDRLAGDVGQLERQLNRVAQAPAAAPPAQQPAQAPPRRRGPDPDRVHEIRTANAPAKGPASAPIVIAEFSDFQ